MKKIFTFMMVLFALLLVSCSSPLDRKYNKETLDDDVKAMRESGVADDDMMAIGGWVMKSAIDNTNLDGKTYRDILKDAKDYSKKQKELEEKARKEAELLQKKMKEAAVISIYKKDFVAADYESYNVFSYVVKNTGDKDIKAFKAEFTITNVLGDEIGDGYRFDCTDHTVKVGEEYKTDVYFEYNRFINSTIEIKETPFKDLNFDIKITKIVYTDGSVLE